MAPIDQPAAGRRPAAGSSAIVPFRLDATGYATLTRDVRDLLGLDLAKYKPDQIWRRVVGFGAVRGYADPAALLAACRGDPTLADALRDLITINVSEFFRNPEAWEALRTLFLDQILARPIARIWSAGCSLGCEPYTIAMLVRERSATASTRIMATDVDATILARARTGRYTAAQLAGVSAVRRNRFFVPAGETWEVRPELGALVTWRRHDLLRDPFARAFDLIACRNVVIYFTEDAKAALYRAFADSLATDGILLLGATETIANPRAVGLESAAPGFYRKLG